MVTYRLSKVTDYERALDFGNYVFSNAHQPHDFSKLLPKTYRCSENFAEVPHFLAERDDGCLRGMIALRPTPFKILEHTLSIGFVGTVSVHPYARGEGHMKRLMSDMLSYAKENGFDMLVLGGQRQRYAYFGFENVGTQLTFHINTSNIRHCFGALDASKVSFVPFTQEHVASALKLQSALPVSGIRTEKNFIDFLKSWESDAYAVLNDGAFAGYITGDGMEIVLEDDDLFYTVIKAYFDFSGIKDMSISCGAFEKERIGKLNAICESNSIGYCEKMNILSWKLVLPVLLELKAVCAPIPDSVQGFDIDGEVFTITVKDGKCTVTDGAVDPLKLTHMQAQDEFFLLSHAVCGSVLPAGWSPLPFRMSSCDTF